MVSASAGRNKGRGAGVQGHCATGPAPTPAPRRPRNGAPAAASGLRAARRHSGHADAGKCKPSREAPVSNQAGRGRRASHLDRGWGRGGNTLCLEIRRLSPQLFILSKTVSSPPANYRHRANARPAAGSSLASVSFPPAHASGVGWGRVRAGTGWGGSLWRILSATSE